MILTEQEYIDAMREVSLLIDLDPEPNSPEGARLALLGDLVLTYEANHHPMQTQDLSNAINSNL